MNLLKGSLCCALCAGLIDIGPSADAGTISYTYDPAGRLVSADYGGNRTTSYAYDNAGNLLQSFQPTPGLSIIGRIGNQLTLAWPASPGGFVLQRATSLGPGAQWTDAGLTPSLVGDLYVATVQIGTQAAYYRLRK